MDEFTHRIGLVRDALIGVAFWLPDPRAFLYPFVDYLAILFQRPVSMCVWSKDQPSEPIFCLGDSASETPSDFRLCPRSSVVDIPPPSPNDAPRYCMRVSSESRAHIEPESGFAEAISRILYHEDMRETDRGNIFLTMLEGALAEYAESPQLSVSDTQDWPACSEEIDMETIRKLLLPMQDILTSVLGTVEDSPFLRIRQMGGVSFSNPFSAVSFPFFTQQGTQVVPALLLTKTQEVAASAYLRNHGFEAKNTHSALEQVFGFHTSAALRGIFRRGVVAFADIEDTVSDVSQRQDACRTFSEDAPLASLREFLGARTSLSMFCVPIHVQGVPWLTLLTFLPRDVGRSWHTAFHIYRDIVPRIASQIRSGAKESFLSLLGQELRAGLAERHSPGETIKKVTSRWRRLSQVYPFQAVTLEALPQSESASAAESELLHTFRGGSPAYVVVQTGNPYYPEALHYDRLLPGSVIVACAEGLREYLEAEKKIERQSVAYATHLLRTPLEQLKACAMSLPESSRKEAIEALLRDLIDLEEFSNCIIRQREQRRPLKKRTSVLEFYSRVAEIISQSIELHRVEKYAGSTADLVDEMLASGEVRVDARIPDEMPREGSVLYYPQQLRVVIDGLLSNAFKYMASHEPSIRIRLASDTGAGTRRVSLQVTNPTNRTKERLHVLAADLCNSADIDWIGITIIHLACEACENFLPPEWRASYPFLEANVQIATLTFQED